MKCVCDGFLQRVMKEKNVLAERLKNAELARKRFDEELKRFATETVTREEVRQSLEDEVRRLTQTVGQTEGGLREKEEQVMRCEAYIDGMEAKLHACQVSSSSLLCLDWSLCSISCMVISGTIMPSAGVLPCTVLTVLLEHRESPLL